MSSPKSWTSSPVAGSTAVMLRPVSSQQRLFSRAPSVPSVTGGRPMPREGQPSGLERWPSGSISGSPPQVEVVYSWPAPPGRKAMARSWMFPLAVPTSTATWATRGWP